MHQHEDPVAEPHYGQDEDCQEPAVSMEQPPEKETKRRVEKAVDGSGEHYEAELHVHGPRRVGKQKKARPEKYYEPGTEINLHEMPDELEEEGDYKADKAENNQIFPQMEIPLLVSLYFYQ
jgi:hypothetical protein